MEYLTLLWVKVHKNYLKHEKYFLFRARIFYWTKSSVACSTNWQSGRWVMTKCPAYTIYTIHNILVFYHMVLNSMITKTTKLIVMSWFEFTHYFPWLQWFKPDSSWFWTRPTMKVRNSRLACSRKSMKIAQISWMNQLNNPAKNTHINLRNKCFHSSATSLIFFKSINQRIN